MEENETLKAGKQSVESAVVERNKTEAKRAKKKMRRLRRKIDHYEEERRDRDRL